MAIKALNSVAGFSVGEVPANIILANGDITSTNGNFTANLSAGNVKTDNLLYANGTPWDLGGVPGGSNTYVQFNDAGEFNGVSNFTFDKATNILTVTGNIAGSNVNAGNLLTANFVSGVLITNAQPNITSVGTLSSLSVTGNIIGGNVYANSGTIGATNLTGTLTTAAQPNITSVGTLSSLTVTANVGAGNLNTTGTANVGTLEVTGTSNLGPVGNVTITGGSSGYYLQTNGSGTLTWAAIPAGTGISNGTSNVSIPAVNGNINMSVAGNANVAVVTGTGLLVNGSANVTGNLTAGNIVAGSGSGGNISGADYVTANFFTGTLTTAAQPNITSVGTLTSLDVSGNANVANLGTSGLIVATGNVTGGNLVTTGTANIGNLKISGTVEGNLIPSVSNTYSLGNSTNYWKNLFLSGTTITLGDQVITSNSLGISLSNTAFLSTLSVSGNANVGNLGTAGLIVATGNITGGNLMGPLANGNSNVQIATSNGNITLTAVSNTTMTITGTGANITGTLNATGNANVANLGTTDIVATGAGSFGANVNMNNQWINNVGYPSANTDVATKIYVDTMVSTGIAYHQPVQVATTTTLATATGGTITYNNGTAGVGANIVTTGTFLLIDGANVQTAGTRILVKNEANAAHNGIYEYTSSTVITRTADADEYGPDSTEQLSINDYFFVQSGTVNEGIAYIVSSPSGTITFGTSNIVFAEFSTSQVYNAGTGLTLSGTTFSISNTTVTSATYGNGDRIASFTVNEQGQLTAASNIVNAPNAANLTGTTLASGITSASLTSLGTLTSLAVTGNITGGNVYANSGTVGALYLSGTLTTAAQPNITSVGTLTTLDVTGNISAPNFIGNVVGNISGNITIPGSNTGVVFNDSGDANSSNGFTFNKTSNLVTIAGNANVGNLISSGVVTATGNVSGGNVTTGGAVVATGNVSGGNVTTGGVVSATGNVTGANLITAGNVFAPAIVQNASSYDTRISLNSAAGIIEANAGGNATQFLPGGSMRLPSGGPSDILGGTFDGSTLTLNNNDAILTQSRGGNVKIQVGAGGTVANTWTFAQNGSFTAPGNITTTANANVGNLNTGGIVSATGNVSGGNLTTGGAVVATGNVSGGNLVTTGVAVANSGLRISNSAVYFGTLTTTSITANQTIATLDTAGTYVTGIEYLVKGVDSTGAKYSVGTVVAVTDGTNADYSTFATVNLGGATGTLAVNISGSNIELQVTPASSNSTVWTTQFRVI